MEKAETRRKAEAEAAAAEAHGKAMAEAMLLLLRRNAERLKQKPPRTRQAERPWRKPLLLQRDAERLRQKPPPLRRAERPRRKLRQRNAGRRRQKPLRNLRGGRTPRQGGAGGQNRRWRKDTGALSHKPFCAIQWQRSHHTRHKPISGIIEPASTAERRLRGANGQAAWCSYFAASPKPDRRPKAGWKGREAIAASFCSDISKAALAGYIFARVCVDRARLRVFLICTASCRSIFFVAPPSEHVDVRDRSGYQSWAVNRAPLKYESPPNGHRGEAAICRTKSL